MSMPPDKAVFTAMAVTLTTTTAASILPSDMGGQGKLPPARLLIGTSFTFMGLSILTDLAPKVGVMLAASIAVTAVTYYGVPLADAYFTGNKPTKKKGKTP